MTLRSTTAMRSRRQLRDSRDSDLIQLGAVLGDAAHQLLDQRAIDAGRSRADAAGVGSSSATAIALPPAARCAKYRPSAPSASSSGLTSIWCRI